jgi:hypothetical protein
LFCFALGALGLIIEKPSKNVQLMSFFVPKAMEILFNLIKEKGLIRDLKWHQFAAVIVSASVIGLQASR